MPAKFSRRNLFRLKSADLSQLWAKSRREKEGIEHDPPAPIRPPGALRSEPGFLAACERCHKCAEACPYNAIQLLGPIAGNAEGTPFLEPAANPCRWCASMDCIEACPSGALRFGENRSVESIARAVIDPQRCLVDQGILCDTCAMRCPTHIKAIRMRGRFPELDADRCTGCGLCAFHCDAEPGAISIQPLPTPDEESRPIS